MIDSIALPNNVGPGSSLRDRLIRAGSLDFIEREVLTGMGRHKELRDFYRQSFAGKIERDGLNLTAADYVFLLDPWWNRSDQKSHSVSAYCQGHR